METISYQALNFTTFTPGLYINGEVIQSVCKKLPGRILEIGCGVGENLLKLTHFFPKAEWVGIDVSAQNIENARLSAKKYSSAVTFTVADYLHFSAAPFDVIYAESVLQLIAADDETLFAKLANDLSPGGVLVVTMPYDCFYNRLVIAGRWLLNKLRNKYLDRFILRLAKLVYASVSIDALVDRLPYMYIVPTRLDSQRLRKKLASHRLTVVKSQICISTSVAKLKHKLIVLRKNES